MTDDIAAARILFVCLGNICRSPTAEVVLRTAARRAGIASHIEIDSAGTGDWHIGSPPDSRAIAHAARRGYDLSMLRGRQVTREDFAHHDWIFAMDDANLGGLRQLRPPTYAGHLGLFLEMAPALGVREVPDPYTGGPEVFETMIDLIEAASDAFVERLAGDHRRAAR